MAIDNKPPGKAKSADEKPQIPPACPPPDRFDIDPERLYRIYESIWKNMARENDIMSHRLNWAIVFSAGIFAATSVLLTAIAMILGADRTVPLYPSNLIAVACILVLMAILSFTGVVFAARAHQGVIAAQEQHDSLKRHYDEYDKRFAALGLPQPFGQTSQHNRGNKAATVFPVMMLRIWATATLIETMLAAAALTAALMLPTPVQAQPQHLTRTPPMTMQDLKSALGRG